jgi:AraC-like DNA-binding protein
MAKTLLVDDTRYTLAAIAEQLGYKNQYDFARQFKKSTGLTPGQYRSQNR